MTSSFKLLTLYSCLIFSSASFADDIATLDNNGKLSISNLKVKGDASYSVELSTTSSPNFPPTYQLNSATAATDQKNPQAIYYPTAKNAVINGVNINGDKYRMSLSQTDQGYKVTNLTPYNAASIWYLVTSSSVQIINNGNYTDENSKIRSIGLHLVVPKTSNIKMFSDRPFRIANNYSGGLTSFSKFYNGADFTTGASEYPNVVFVATDSNGREITSIFDIKDVFVSGDSFVISVNKAIGDSSLPIAGTYQNGSFVIDSWWDDITGSVTHVFNVVKTTVTNTIHTAVNDVESVLPSSVDNVLNQAASDVESAADEVKHVGGDVFNFLKGHFVAICKTGMSKAIEKYAVNDECAQVAAEFEAECSLDTAELDEADGLGVILCTSASTVIGGACKKGVQKTVVQSSVNKICDSINSTL